jgi:hypothetical protein
MIRTAKEQTTSAKRKNNGQTTDIAGYFAELYCARHDFVCLPESCEHAAEINAIAFVGFRRAKQVFLPGGLISFLPGESRMCRSVEETLPSIYCFIRLQLIYYKLLFISFKPANCSFHPRDITVSRR